MSNTRQNTKCQSTRKTCGINVEHGSEAQINRQNKCDLFACNKFKRRMVTFTRIFFGRVCKRSLIMVKELQSVLDICLKIIHMNGKKIEEATLF